MQSYWLQADVTAKRLDIFLASAIPEYTRSFWQKACERGQVRVEGAVQKPSYHLKNGESVIVELPDKPDFSSQTLPILYEDADVLVIDKPAGMLTHAKGPISDEFTVADFVRRYTTDGLDTNRPGIVHRLDRGTSGVIIAAKTAAAKRWLQKQFSQRKVKKTYTALVQGHPEQPTALLQLPIGRNPRQPQTFQVSASGKPAETTYETIHSYPHHTLLAMRPLTGRTHQLRVHAAYIKHPIVGDIVYGKPDNILTRPFLHASSLEITLPSRERKVFTAPLPADLQTYLKTVE
ncbi:MAG TPA: RluA family pseudouridine synthase [Candidatus Acidoferrum sp.]|nr:RluA family pseudouridine synthase [Candidatus Acidoferrum sp.]